MQKALTNRQEKIRANLMDNADWGEAYNNLHKQVNVKWAWAARTLVNRFTRITSMKAYLFLSPAGETRYSVIEGNLVSQPFEKWLNRTSPKNFLTTSHKARVKPSHAL
ncbi:hypothetical protein LJU42_00900 [Citrobacter freundii]|uniref:CHASE4 domain-containing protein n=1 Tax=Citrobacter freundii TaxID=546 RepID=UPI001D100BF6|nr:CHASE4 domain-containing protein [Citrobacter freundii]UDV22682.1 hypothetical protein LJU42_00900 [Citrobacter freundii]